MTTKKQQTPSAKDRVLSWVRSKNPQTMELRRGCRIVIKNEDTHYIWGGERVIYDYCLDGEQISDVWCHGWKKYKVDEIDKILGSDMGLQEFCKCIDEEVLDFDTRISCGDIVFDFRIGEEVRFDLTKNLHSQDDSFYEALLPLLA